jgi:hypothetical protein
MLTDFVAAPLEEVQLVLRAPADQRTWPHLQDKSVDPVKLCTLWAILDHRTPRVEETVECTQQFKELAAAGADGPWVVQVPPALVEKMGALVPSQLATIAAAWAKTEEAQLDGWRTEDTRETLVSLSKLASWAVQNKKALLLWFSL